ncbi:hypothetical protein C2G38_2234361 [Gigaspora rosea]|uniref:Uncharacterized protein n=1 Tax=Gigaspora rosea TaxID=44941 RepID=A0A397TSM0_9GLOM|nr:hypothetical protein C2G38_2234361 [Gigaspora rosea]
MDPFNLEHPIYYLLKNFDGSLDDLNKSLKFKNNAFALRTRGQTYYMLGHYEESLDDLDNSLKIDQDNKVALFLNDSINSLKIDEKIQLLYCLGGNILTNWNIEPENIDALKTRGQFYFMLNEHPYKKMTV